MFTQWHSFWSERISGIRQIFIETGLEYKEDGWYRGSKPRYYAGSPYTRGDMLVYIRKDTDGWFSIFTWDKGNDPRPSLKIMAEAKEVTNGALHSGDC